MYGYETPDGYGDSFFIYNFNGEDIPLVNGNSYTLVGVTIDDGMFVCRVWSGGALIVNTTTGTVQMYDGVKNAWFLYQPILMGSMFPPGLALCPEKVYRDNSAFRFDLTNVALTVNNNGTAKVYADQMAWYGVKRVPGGPSDPLKSTYRYYEKPFSYPIACAINNYGPSDGAGNPIAGLAAPTQFSILIQDYDFELRRISLVTTGAGTQATINFGGEAQASTMMTAVQAGVAGNSITFTVVTNNGVPNGVFSIAVVGTAITITQASNNLGTPTTTGDDVAIAMNSNPAASALVTTVVLGAGGSIFQTGNSGPANMTGGSGGGSAGITAYASPFKIMLYDATWRQRMTVPILSELLCYSQNVSVPDSLMPNNNWPSPPMMYPVNSVIRFDIFSLIPTGDSLPVTANLLFEGVRRIAC